MIRVLIAEDSPTARTYLRQLLQESPEIEVVGEAHDGEEAVRFTHELKPDIVTMDIHMPHVDGLTATRRIMAEVPTPVVVVSGLLTHDVDLSLQAIASGALAVVAKPPARAAKDFATRRHELLTTIKAMAEVKVVARRDHLRDAAPPPARSTPKRSRPQVLAIGASTGGPSAIQRILSALPANYPVPIVVVQHMPDEFIGGLVRWLNNSTPLTVQLAQHGMTLRAGTVAIAQGNSHCLVRKRDNELMIVLASDDDTERYQPSINILFESVREACGREAVGVVLTGMGDDGAEGLAHLQEAGALTLIQDALSSTVYGMPEAARKRNDAHEMLSLSDIPTRLLEMV